MRVFELPQWLVFNTSKTYLESHSVNEPSCFHSLLYLCSHKARWCHFIVIREPVWNTTEASVWQVHVVRVWVSIFNQLIYSARLQPDVIILSSESEHGSPQKPVVTESLSSDSEPGFPQLLRYRLSFESRYAYICWLQKSTCSFPMLQLRLRLVCVCVCVCVCVFERGVGVTLVCCPQ